KIDLVENNQRLFSESVEFLDNSLDRFHLLIHTGMVKIGNVNEQIGLADFLESRLERFDQRVRKFPQEPNCVGKQDPLFVRQNETARRWIQRCKKLVLGYEIGTGKQIQQRRFASVGVADNGGD